MISISPCTAAQDWTAHLSNPLSFGRGVEQCLVKLKISSSGVEVVISFDVSVHKVRLKVVFDLGILAVGCVHVS